MIILVSKLKLHGNHVPGLFLPQDFIGPGGLSELRRNLIMLQKDFLL